MPLLDVPEELAVALRAALTAANVGVLPPPFIQLGSILNNAAATHPSAGPSQLLQSGPQQLTIPHRRVDILSPNRQPRRVRASSLPAPAVGLWDVRPDMSFTPPTHMETNIVSSMCFISPGSIGSTPTLVGTPAPDKSCWRSVLSPLCYDDETLPSIAAGRSPSPSPAPIPSRPNRRSGKRHAEEMEDSDSAEEGHSSRHGTGEKLKIRVPPRQQVAAGAGGGDGGGGAGGAGGPAHLWTEDCNRKGDRRRVGTDADIGMMGENEEDVEGSQTRPRKRRKRNMGWREAASGAPVTQRAGELLSELLSIHSMANRDALEKLLATCDTDFSTSSSSTDIASTVESIRTQTEAMQIYSLRYMLTLVQLALNVDSFHADNKLKHLPKLSQEKLASMYAGSTPRKTFSNWINWGKRLLVLCAAGTMYILPILATLDMRTKITGPSWTESDIMSLASALREVKLGQWRPMVQRLMIPINFMRNHKGYLQTLDLKFNVPKPVNEVAESISISFNDVELTDRILDGVETQAYKLPERSEEWTSPSVVNWMCLDDATKIKLAPVHKLKTPLKFTKSKSPLTKENRNQWTEDQRALAEQAIVATSLEDLEELSEELHAEGVLKPDMYVEVNSSILDGKALYMEDADGKFLSLLFTVPPEYRQLLIDAMDHIHALMPGEFKDEDSRRKFYNYLACHYSWYARFGEKGKGAPSNVHPNNLRKDHEGRVNFEQRLPHQSKEALKNPGEYAQLAEAYTDFFELLRVAFKHYLPEEYDELHIYAESLPLGASSPAYPFAGFVINISACSWSHRDVGDKILCFVIPCGKFEGGQLCLYELGFSFDLQTGDVFAFPSCDITHFNCHFKGLRTTLVLHSDREGDGWVKNCRGWGAHIVRHD